MSHPRPFRFGLVFHQGYPDRVSASAWAGLAQRVEELGYDALYLSDHFGRQLAPVAAIASAAAATSTLRLGCLVFDNDYRHPLVLAKEVASLDVLSEGRLEVGMGAGWKATDYTASGIPMDRAGVRVSRMIEGVQVLRGCLGEDPFSFEGEYYRISDYDGFPKPVQQPVPLIIGGGGKRVLSFAGRTADIVGIDAVIPNGRFDGTAAHNVVAEMTDQKVAWVRDAAGDRYPEMELSVAIREVAISGRDRSEALREVGSKYGLTEEATADYALSCVGDIDRICEDLVARRDRWDISHYVFTITELETMAPVVAALAGK